jgi:hypothetical protein
VRAKWEVRQIPFGRKPVFVHHPEGICETHPKGISVEFRKLPEAIQYVLDSLREKRCVRRNRSNLS